jgi:hypothetical protein
MDVNDNWVFEEYAPSSPGTKLLGFGIKAAAFAVPVEDYDNMINEVKDYVSIVIQQDQDFGVKNAPLSMYVTHMKNTRSGDVLNETSVQLDGENAVEVNYVGTGTMEGSKFIQIYTMHNDKPYFISYLGYGDKFDNKLSEFEEMLTSFKWEE